MCSDLVDTSASALQDDYFQKFGSVTLGVLTRSCCKHLKKGMHTVVTMTTGEQGAMLVPA